jgi:multidrug resistance efflux pump
MMESGLSTAAAQINTRLPVPEDVPAVPAEPLPEAEPQRKPRSAAPRVGLIALLVILGLLAWHVMGDLCAPTSSTGSVTAFSAQIAPRVAGQVVEVYVADNQTVAAGDPLFALDPAPFDLALRQAEIALLQAELGAQASSLSVTGAQAQLAQAQVTLENTEANTERSHALFDRGLATQAQLDAADAQLASARSSVEAAQAELARARTQTGEAGGANPQVEAARIQLDQARLNRDFATVTAPNDGVITNLKLTAGQFVNAGSPALTFIEGHTPWVVVDMRENQLANIDVGDPASVVFDAVPGRTFEGRVLGIAWGIDPGRTAANGLPQNQASTRWFEPARTIPVQIGLADTETWPQNVRMGSKANAAVYAMGTANPVAWITSALQTVGAYLSYLY